MGGRADPGLVMAARALPCAILLFTRYTDEEITRHRHRLTQVALGADVPLEEIEDSIIEGAQGLGGITILGVLLSAASIWVSRYALYVPFSALAAVSAGLTVFTGTLAAIYGARTLWRRPRSLPRRSDFWVSVACGLLVTILVLTARLTTA